jgi:hypothetical protein
MLRFLLTPSCAALWSVPTLLSGAIAQLPTDSVVVLESTAASFGTTSYVIADSAGGGATAIGLSLAPIFPDAPMAIAVDPASAAELYLLYDDASITLPGIYRQPIGLNAQGTGQPGAQWTQLGGQRMEVGATRIFTLRTGGIVEATPKTGTNPLLLLTQPNAVDIATAGNFLYIACAGGGVPAPLIEFSLQTGAQRVVGNYTGITCVAAAENGTELAVGTQAGQLLELDLATGAVQNTLATGTAVLAADYTAAGDLVWAINQGPGYEIRSQAVARPLHTSSLTFLDLAVSSVVTPSTVAFGAGCGSLATTSWFANSLPVPGNANYTIEAYTSLPNAPLLLFAGSSRLQSTVLSQPLPFDLAVIGAAGCRLLVDPIASALLPNNPLGIAALGLPVPPGTALLGAEFSVQAFTPDATVQPLGIAAAPGLAFRIF